MSHLVQQRTSRSVSPMEVLSPAADIGFRVDSVSTRQKSGYSSCKWLITHNERRPELGKNRPACGVAHTNVTDSEIYVPAAVGCVASL
jgi:hypothetical protein